MTRTAGSSQHTTVVAQEYRSHEVIDSQRATMTPLIINTTGGKPSLGDTSSIGMASHRTERLRHQRPRGRGHKRRPVGDLRAFKINYPLQSGTSGLLCIKNGPDALKDSEPLTLQDSKYLCLDLVLGFLAEPVALT